LVEYYFDIETIGCDESKHKIITIQYQRLDEFTGQPLGDLVILKEWGSSEKDILAKFIPIFIGEKPFDFIPIGDNLPFDFEFMRAKSEKYGEKKETLFDERERKLRDQAAERGRRKVPILIRKSVDSQFAKLKYNPYDIKALLHPVDFVVFDGLESKEDLRKIVFLSKAVDNEQLNGLRNSIEKTVEEKRYNWQVARVPIDGRIEMTES